MALIRCILGKFLGVVLSITARITRREIYGAPGWGKKPVGKRADGRPRHGWGGILLKLVFRK